MALQRKAKSLGLNQNISNVTGSNKVRREHGEAKGTKSSKRASGTGTFATFGSIVLMIHKTKRVL
jgi:hypothetical protein